jgi:vanillate O-demethylase ferredoxin subunit
VTAAARRHGWPDGRIHTELFAAPATPPSNGDRAFDVRLARSGRQLTVPAGQSVADCLAGHGVDIPTSCRQGVCGACQTTVLDGEPDHRDFYLNDAERTRNDSFLPCCSRARGPLLVLDL